MPPARMSDVLPSTASTPPPAAPTAPTAPTSSDGPTLPLITTSAAAAVSDPSATKKRKRPAAQKQSSTEKNSSAVDSHNTPRTNHPALYTPWVLLPPRERKGLAASGVNVGLEDVEGHAVQVLVWSRNQNVRAGVRRLKEALSAPSAGADGDAVEQRASILAVSAQGEGTVKLVGIVDMVRRMAEHKSEPDLTSRVAAREGGEESPKVVNPPAGKDNHPRTWYLYPVLSSVLVPRQIQKESRATQTSTLRHEPLAHEAEERHDKEGEGEDVDMDTVPDVDGAAHTATAPSKDAETSHTRNQKTVPVLTVWFSSTRIPGWRDAFGEHEVEGRVGG